MLFPGKTPLILQSETNECGLACLAMMAGYFGKRIDLASARTLHGIGSHGMTLRISLRRLNVWG